MVFGIVKKHQGYINVYIHQGMGTTFKIYLPFAQLSAQQEVEKIEDTAPLRGGTETILIAEDDDALRNMAVTSLSQYGYTEEILSGAGIPKEVDAFIQKPISPSVLVRRIRKILDE